MLQDGTKSFFPSLPSVRQYQMVVVGRVRLDSTGKLGWLVQAKLNQFGFCMKFDAVVSKKVTQYVFIS